MAPGGPPMSASILGPQLLEILIVCKFVMIRMSKTGQWAVVEGPFDRRSKVCLIKQVESVRQSVQAPLVTPVANTIHQFVYVHAHAARMPTSI